MNTKLNYRPLLTAFFSAAFVFIVGLSAVQNADAQRKFDPKATGTETELRNVANFTQELVNFLKLADLVDQNSAVSEDDHKKLRDTGKRVKDGTSNARTNLQGFISKLKAANRWNDDFDAEFLDAIVSPRIKAFIQKAGGARKALTAAEAALNAVGQQVDAAINDAKKPRAENIVTDVFFMNASFSSNPNYVFSARKFRVGCFLLGVGIAAAEIARAKLTAENLDNVFDSKCGGSAPTT